MKNIFQHRFQALFKKMFFFRQTAAGSILYLYFKKTFKRIANKLKNRCLHTHFLRKCVQNYQNTGFNTERHFVSKGQSRRLVFESGSFRRRTFLTALTAVEPGAYDLSGLKDVIIPVKPPLFPLQWGWWVAGVAVLFLSVILWRLFRYFYPTPKTYALRLLKELQKKNLPPVLAGRELSKLLKRVALVCFPRETVAHLSQKEWSTFLSEQGNRILSKEQADFIAAAPYMPLQKSIALDEKKVYTAIGKWIHFVFKRTHSWKSSNRIS